MSNQKGLVQRIERKLENTVGDAFARVFGGSIVPQEVEALLRREASDGVQTLPGDRFLAPNYYVITLSGSDFEKVSADRDLTSDTFAKHLEGYISEQGWQTYGDVVVRFEQSPSLHTGQYRARGVVNPDANPHLSAGAPAPAESNHAFTAEPGVPPMSDNPSYRGDQGQGRPADEPYDERYARPQEEPRAGAPEQRGPVPARAGWLRPAERARLPPAGRLPRAGRLPGPGLRPGRLRAATPGRRLRRRLRTGLPSAPARLRTPAGGALRPSARWRLRRPAAQRLRLRPPHPVATRSPATAVPSRARPTRIRAATSSRATAAATAVPTTASPSTPATSRVVTPSPPARDYDYGQPAGRRLRRRLRAAGPARVPVHRPRASPCSSTTAAAAPTSCAKAPTSIGRGQDAQFRLPDTGVSRRHLEIRWDGQVALLSGPELDQRDDGQQRARPGVAAGRRGRHPAGPLRDHRPRSLRSAGATGLAGLGGFTLASCGVQVS